MPSSLTEVLSSTLVCSTCPPESVCGTGAVPLARGFSWRLGSIRAAWTVVRTFPSPLGQRQDGFAYLDSLPAWRPRDPGPTTPRPPIAHNGRQRYRNLNLLSITYASRPRLRPDSPAVDQHGCGTLGHSVEGIRTPLSLLMPTFALPSAPDLLPRLLHCCLGRSPTILSNPQLRHQT